MPTVKSLNWNIVNLERSLPDGLVVTSHWTLVGTEEGFTGSVYGAVTLLAKDPLDETFVAFEDITKTQAIEWTKEALGAETVAAHEAAVQAQIDAQKAPKTASGLPW